MKTRVTTRCLTDEEYFTGYEHTSNVNQDLEEILTSDIISQSSIRSDIIELPSNEKLNEWRSIIVPISQTYGTPKHEVIGGGCFVKYPVTESFKRFSGDDVTEPVSQSSDSSVIFKGYSMSYNNCEDTFQDGDQCSFIFTWTDKIWNHSEERTGSVTVSPFLDGVILDTIRISPEKQGQGHGTRFLNIVLNKSREARTKLYVFPGILEESSISLNQDQLCQWYVRHGFVKSLPLFLPVTRLSYFKGGDTFVKKSGFYVFCP